MSASLEIYLGKQPKQKLFKFNKDTGKIISSQAHFLDAVLRSGGSIMRMEGWMQSCQAWTRTLGCDCVGDAFRCAWFHFSVMLGK